MAFTIPNLLTHYTDLHGLVGIITSRQVWCSNIRFLNDSKEYVHGLEAIIAAFQVATDESGDGTPELRAFVNAGLLNTLQQAADDPMVDAPCVASFSMLSDDLSQWRGYGGDPGICVRFDGESLSERAGKSNAFLFPCFYDVDNLSQMSENVTKVVNRQPLGGTLDDLDSFAQVLNSGLDEIVVYCLKVSCLFKEPAFAAEQEWRIVCNTAQDRIGFRQRGRILVPYMAVELWAESSECPIREIGIGPGEHQRLNEAAIRCLLDANGLGKVIVNTSKVPFRKFQ
ncbi:MAG: DUF2971 domain-containing protein [Rhodanobacteraceae bacterium]